MWHCALRDCAGTCIIIVLLAYFDVSLQKRYLIGPSQCSAVPWMSLTGGGEPVASQGDKSIYLSATTPAMATKLGQALWPYWLRTWDKAPMFFLVDKITGKINGTYRETMGNLSINGGFNGKIHYEGL